MFTFPEKWIICSNIFPCFPSSSEDLCLQATIYSSLHFVLMQEGLFILLDDNTYNISLHSFFSNDNTYTGFSLSVDYVPQHLL